MQGVLVGKPEGNRPREGLKRRWGDNIKMDINDSVWQGMTWNNLVENRKK